MSVPENDNQPVQQPSNSENPTKPVGMLTYFWWTILALISVTVVLLILATLNQNPQPEEERRVRIEQGKESPQPEEGLRARAERRKGLILRRVLRPELFKKTDNAIDETIDSAFEPIYSRIPEFLDWHYSVVGQYQQLGAAALGTLESQMESRLFSGVNERLENASVNIDETFKAEYRFLISQKVHDEVQTVDNESKTTYERMLNEAMQRFTSFVPASGFAALQSAIGGKALFGAITKAMSKKLLTSVAAKTTVKAATKMVGAGGAAATGAAIGAFLGPIGVAIGGISGAVIGWLAVDAVVVAVDKHFKRDEFEQELIALIDKRKGGIKSLMQEAKSSQIKELSKTLENVPPSQM